MDPLLTLLRNNARVPIEDLAKELNCEAAEVRDKIAQLEAEGVILGYQAVLDPLVAPGHAVTACIEVKVTPERGGGFDRLAQRIAKFAEVQGCYLMSGGYDLLVVVEGDTLQEVATFISEKLSTIKGVVSTATRFRLKAYKENGVSLVKEAKSRRLVVSP
jgi:DNA-binding Lrp family transcriptional regulator